MTKDANKVFAEQFRKLSWQMILDLLDEAYQVKLQTMIPRDGDERIFLMRPMSLKQCFRF